MCISDFTLLLPPLTGCRHCQ